MTESVRDERILARIRSIPEGRVSTYGDIEPGAPRLVGRVLSRTSEPLPWHRVVRADGSVAKGERQLGRLRIEGVPIRGNRVDLRQARYPPFGWGDERP
jgi:methylated-DNA-protein-cysteine methyltransferase related protein